jgi:hypothetical protein
MALEREDSAFKGDHFRKFRGNVLSTRRLMRLDDRAPCLVQPICPDFPEDLRVPISLTFESSSHVTKPGHGSNNNTVNPVLSLALALTIHNKQ